MSMYELNPEIRLEIYLVTREYIRRDIRKKEFVSGLCWAIKHAHLKVLGFYPDGKRNPYSHMEAYPEVYELRPEDCNEDAYWFLLTVEGQKMRLDLMTRAIRKLRKELKEGGGL